ncbi:hypothetical protein EAI87_03420 [Enterococcus mundtii]|nr:hypothetical protein EAI87_03420 [Enterococcus mundtii]
MEQAEGHYFLSVPFFIFFNVMRQKSPILYRSVMNAVQYEDCRWQLENRHVRRIALLFYSTL